MPLDPKELLKRMKKENQVLVWQPLPPERIRRAAANPQNRNRESLEFLHHHWVLPDSFDPAGAGRGVRGKVVNLFARLTYRVLGPYLREERSLLAHLVRVNEGLEQRCDELVLRCQQLSQDMIDRQVAEAENQSKLAVWLHLDPPLSTNPDGPKNGIADNGETASQ